MIETLPDSRLQRLTSKLVPHKEWGMAEEIFCYNCGKSGGFVPAGTTTHASYICTSPCWEKFGNKTAFLAIPESEVRRSARLRQLEKEQC